MEADARRNAEMIYKLKPPKYFEDQTVQFKDHQGNLQIGKIMFIETHYDHNHEAYHTYRIRVIGWERARYVGEDSIQGLI